jgi:fatty-acyl-CoA synthase
MPLHPVYLWTLPMFTATAGASLGRWPCRPAPALPAQGGAGADLRSDPRTRVTHLCGAPIVYGMLINAPESQRAGITHAIDGLIAGSAPPRPSSRAASASESPSPMSTA